MNIRNKKGFFGIDDVIFVAIIVAGLVIGGPALMKAGGSIIHGGADKVHKTMHTKSSQEPVKLGVDSKGRDVIGYKTKNEASTEALSEDEQPTLWQKIKSVFWVLIGVAIFCAIFPASVLAKLKNQALQAASDKLDELQAKHDALKAETAKIVTSVQAARVVVTDPATKAAMTTAMDKTQNDSTKALVADIKTNGTITTL